MPDPTDKPEEGGTTTLTDMPPELRHLLALERMNEQLQRISEHVVRALDETAERDREQARSAKEEADARAARAKFWSGGCGLIIEGLRGFGTVAVEYSRDARIRWTVAAGCGIVLLSLATRCGVDPSVLQGIGITVSSPLGVEQTKKDEPIP